MQLRQGVEISIETQFGVKIAACQFEPMLRVKCVISVLLAAPNRISPHLPFNRSSN